MFLFEDIPKTSIDFEEFKRIAEERGFSVFTQKFFNPEIGTTSFYKEGENVFVVYRSITNEDDDSIYQTFIIDFSTPSILKYFYYLHGTYENYSTHTVCLSEENSLVFFSRYSNNMNVIRRNDGHKYHRNSSFFRAYQERFSVPYGSLKTNLPDYFSNTSGQTFREHINYIHDPMIAGIVMEEIPIETV